MVLRFFSSCIILAVIFVASRSLIRTLPGDPVESMIAESGSTRGAEELRHDLGLDRPFLASLRQDFVRDLHGDFGRSLVSGQPIGKTMAPRILGTLELGSAALLFALIISLTLGLKAADHPGSWVDHLCSYYGVISTSLPSPWMGPLLMVAFSVWIPIFPLEGNVILPALTIAIGVSGIWARLVRHRVRESLTHGSAPAARARGISETVVLIKYGLAPASSSLVAFLGTQFAALLTGSLIVEVIFGWRGIGSYLVDAVLKRDYPVVEAAGLWVALISVLGAWGGEFLRSWLDPRFESSR